MSRTEIATIPQGKTSVAAAPAGFDFAQLLSLKGIDEPALSEIYNADIRHAMT